MTMKNLMIAFLREENGQDLIEYTLLLAFVALASAAVFIGAGGSISGIWTTASGQLSTANTAATNSAS
jgi:Flp pilus assembly pilin Flp